MIFKTKYDLGQEVYYGDKYDRRKGEIITIFFDGTFNNIPKYEIEYNGNVWAEDDISDKEEISERQKAMKKITEHTYGNHIYMKLELDGEIYEVDNYAGADRKWKTYKTTADGTDKREAVIKAFNELY